MTYPQAIEFLYGLQMFGAKFGLETTRKLTGLGGNPETRLRFIHVAGTNGKGSTCAMLESIYRQAGLRVGLFTSPHLVSFTERIQVNRKWIPEPDVVRIISELQPWLAQFPRKSHPTFFEVVTVMALRYFAQQQCALVIWETGLGGRLDATNIVTPLASLITNIDFDHQQWLGNTLDKIAAEKAGIIKPAVPVITGASPGRGLEVIAETARQQRAPLHRVTREETTHPPLDTITLPLAGEHQRLNAALAVATVRALDAQIRVTDAAIRDGLSSVRWPGRMTLLRLASGQQVLLDGAHNAASADALHTAFEQQFSKVRPTLLLGVLADKDPQAIATTLAPLAGRILLVPVDSRRTLPPEKLLPACRAANPSAPVEVCSSLAAAMEKARPDPFVVITGSLYLVGEAMELMKLAPDLLGGERGLNEWEGKPGRLRRE